MANFLNGYKHFKFTNSDGASAEFDLKIQAMRESMIMRHREYEDIEGVIHQEFFDLKYLYEIDSSALTTKDNMKKFKTVLTWFIQNKEVTLIPHTDAAMRTDKVVMVTSGGVSDEIEFTNFILNSGSPGNKGFVLKLRSKYPWTNINWIDTDEIIGSISMDDMGVLV